MRLWTRAIRRAVLCLSVAALFCASSASALAFGGTTAPVNGVEGIPVSGTVATFTDGTLLLACTNASAYQATIDWGDGSTSAGQRQPGAERAARGVQLHGRRLAYLRRGRLDSRYSVTVTGPGGTINTGARTATIADAPLSAAGIDFSASKGTSFTTTVATFADANRLAQPERLHGDDLVGRRHERVRDDHRRPGRLRRGRHAHLRGDRELQVQRG